MPYDDLPETDEPLVELETPEEDTRCQLWEDTSPMINLLSDTSASVTNAGASAFQLEPPKSTEKPVLSDLKGTTTLVHVSLGKEHVTLRSLLSDYLSCAG